jgi:hypothetical protein
MHAVAADPNRRTRTLLASGIAAGPVFFAVGIAQALTRAGYDIRRNAISQLSLGDLGWIQISSFLVTGLLALACAVGVRRALTGQPGGTWGPRLIGTFGLGLILAGIFPPDPAFGFPPGAPAGQVFPMSRHADLHALGFFICMLSTLGAVIVFVRRFRALGERGWVAYLVASGVATPVLVALSPHDPGLGRRHRRARGGRDVRVGRRRGRTTAPGGGPGVGETI